MSSKSSNNFSIIYLYCIILRNVIVNFRFYIRYVNIWIAAFTWAYLYWGKLTLTCVFTYVMQTYGLPHLHGHTYIGEY